ncbi:4-hydroxy-3-methylbut-2-enyl diphosphate reductase [Rhizobiales bacterium TNE-4]|nr:4-hydroxy-3-methylbut-2-enyl diphosphate reductase [Rhizobiales bacterium TNE-4]MBV1826918.1 4-hydroxy-3-methylbut-2-enyl diphosphate reductase [Rhizobiales bacterium TNE-4]
MAAALPPLKILLANPRGFCAGVVRAIDIVERALTLGKNPVYVRHEIVHNKHVVETLKGRGAVFVDETDQIPEGALTIFSAHGVSKDVERAAAERRLDVIDATCPLVHKVHNEGRRYAERGFDVILIGHAGHPEVEGTRGQIGGRLHVVGTLADIAALQIADPDKVAFITQTTLSVDDTRDLIAALRARYPTIIGPDTRDICYATQNRQRAVKEMTRAANLVLVIGSANSSNSNRLRELAEADGVPSYLIDGPQSLDPAWLDGVACMGLTAGASAPETLVEATLAALARWRTISVEILAGREENVVFKTPERLLELAEGARV